MMLANCGRKLSNLKVIFVYYYTTKVKSNIPTKPASNFLPGLNDVAEQTFSVFYVS